jgi:hypothetical protein
VFCKVRGRYIDAHLITAVHPKRGWLISNNHGHDNGWTKTIYGRVTKIEYGKRKKAKTNEGKVSRNHGRGLHKRSASRKLRGRRR